MAVKLENHGCTAVLTMNRPNRHNALDSEMRAGLADAIAQIRDDRAVKAVVLTGSGHTFCAGGDVKGLSRAQEGPRDIFEGRARILEMHRWFDMLVDLEKPVIAAVNGPAFGAGLSLTLAADFVLATPDATFCAVFARIGYVPDLAAMYLLPRKIGLSQAKELVFSARVVDAQEARALGLVHQVIDGDLQSAALAFAERFHAGPTEAIGIAKSVMNRAFETDRDAIVLQEAMAQAMCRESDFHREAVRRFVAKEPSTYGSNEESADG
jgi:enoyl-CoA hydratase/carnithine racemase